MTTPPFSGVPGELISALMDGQLRGPLLKLAVHECLNEPDGLRRWHDYHLIGEALRAPMGAGPSGATPAFLQRLQKRLAAESGLERSPHVPAGQ